MGRKVEGIRNETWKEAQALHDVQQRKAVLPVVLQKTSWLAVFIWKTVNTYDILQVSKLLYKRLTALF